MILVGRLFSVTHLTRCALKEGQSATEIDGQVSNQDLPYFGVGVNAMRIFDGSLALTCEHGEDRTRRRIALDAIEGFGHRILPKTLHRVMLEICCRRFVLRVLEATHSLERAKTFARGTLEKVAQAIVVVLDEDVRLEEAIQRGTPGEFEFL